MKIISITWNGRVEDTHPYLDRQKMAFVYDKATVGLLEGIEKIEPTSYNHIFLIYYNDGTMLKVWNPITVKYKGT